MQSKQIGYYLTLIGIFLIAFEYWFSYCSKVNPSFCYFPFSPTEPDLAVPLYSVFILVVGVLMFLGEEKKPEEEKEP